jgi:hypothetical protein
MSVIKRVQRRGSWMSYLNSGFFKILSWQYVGWANAWEKDRMLDSRMVRVIQASKPGYNPTRSSLKLKKKLSLFDT